MLIKLTTGNNDLISQTTISLQVSGTFPPLYVFWGFFRSFAIGLGQCHYWQHKVMPGPYRDCAGSPIPSEWDINMCHYKTVSFTSQHSLKSMRFQETASYSRWAGQALRRSLTHQQDWYQLFCKEEQDDCCQNPTKMAKQSESPINLTPLDACPKPVCSDTLLSRFWESIFDEEKYSFSMDKQLKKAIFTSSV